MMLTILVRILLIYTLLVCSMRLMGKRQIGQLEVSDLVSTLLLSEIAALPVEDLDIPVSYALIPIAFVMSVEIVTAALQSRFPALKNIFSARPAVLIRMGVPDFRELSKARISSDELMAAIRKSGSSDPGEIAYAILEQDGTVSVIPRAAYRPATVGDVGGNATEYGIFHIVIDRGTVNEASLSMIRRSRKWLERALRDRGKETGEVALMLADDGGRVRIFTQEAPNDNA